MCLCRWRSCARSPSRSRCGWCACWCAVCGRTETVTNGPDLPGRRPTERVVIMEAVVLGTAFTTRKPKQRRRKSVRAHRVSVGCAGAVGDLAQGAHVEAEVVGARRRCAAHTYAGRGHIARQSRLRQDGATERALRCFTSSPPSGTARCNSRPRHRHCSVPASRASSAAASLSTAATCCGSAHPSSRKTSR